MTESERDEKELEWWRRVFSCRFFNGDLPKVMTPLYGSHLKVYMQDGPRGEWIPWSEMQERKKK